MAAILGALAVLDAFLWYQAAHTSGADRAGLISSASALLVAVAGVGGTAVGAYLTAEYSRGTTRAADRRATYAHFLGASAAYRQGRERADISQANRDQAFAYLYKLVDKKKADVSSVRQEDIDDAKDTADDWTNRNDMAWKAIPVLESDLRVSAVAARLMSASSVRSKIDALEHALLNGQKVDAELNQALDAMSAST